MECPGQEGLDPKQRKKVSQRVVAWTDQDMLRLEQLLTANADRTVAPPKPVAGKRWTMLDSGSEPNVANCEKVFPQHAIRESEGQRRGLHYKGADGTLIPNKGEVAIIHREADGSLFDFTFQHADVHCPILSVTYLVTRDCTVTFHKHGGHIAYPDGRRIRFVAKGGIFVVLLDVRKPDFTRLGN